MGGRSPRYCVRRNSIIRHYRGKLFADLVSAPPYGQRNLRSYTLNFELRERRHIRPCLGISSGVVIADASASRAPGGRTLRSKRLSLKHCARKALKALPRKPQWSSLVGFLNTWNSPVLTSMTGKIGRPESKRDPPIPQFECRNTVDRTSQTGAAGSNHADAHLEGPAQEGFPPQLALRRFRGRATNVRVRATDREESATDKPGPDMLVSYVSSRRSRSPRNAGYLYDEAKLFNR